MAGEQCTDAAPAVLSADQMGCLRTLVVSNSRYVLLIISSAGPFFGVWGRPATEICRFTWRNR
jgi:hypothetical protein